jgi:hypothetical protein
MPGVRVTLVDSISFLYEVGWWLIPVHLTMPEGPLRLGSL